MREDFKNKIRIFADSLEKRNFEVEKFKEIISNFQEKIGVDGQVDSENSVSIIFKNV
jgi:chromosome segregation ATPase